jgi:nuclear protein localization family protein 4
MSIVLRVRTQIGTWRLINVKPQDTFGNLRKRLIEEHKINIDEPFTSDPAANNPFRESTTVREAKLSNGHMIYLKIDESKMGVHEASLVSKKITKEGNIVQQDITSVLNSSGFRPGMLPLRSMKMHWTLNEFISLDEQFEFKIKHQEKPFCKLVSIDSSSINEFQNYLRNFDFRVMRLA